MNFAESAIDFPCGADRLLGIVSLPETPAPVGVIIAVGGPQYRVGSHRQFTLLARSLAAADFPVLRFDFRGMGDSNGDPCSFEAVTPDISAAIDAFAASVPGVGRFVLWGLCDAASAILLHWHLTRDSRVAGLCLLNPWVRSEATLAKAHVKHYYGRRLLQKAFWVKLLSGKVEVGRALGELFRKFRLSAAQGTAASADIRPFQQRMAEAAESFPGDVLLILSGDDYTAKEFIEAARSDPTWTRALARPRVQRVNVPEADHTFSNAAWRREVEERTAAWLVRIVAEPRSPGG